MEKYVSFVLWELYDTLRIWYVPPRVREITREVDLSLILGSEVNHGEFLYQLDVVDSTDWSEVPLSQARRDTRSDNHSPDRTNISGDFIWYDPYTRAVIKSVTARSSYRLKHHFGGYLPTRFVLDADASVVKRVAGSSVVVPTSDNIMEAVMLTIFPP